MPANAVIRYFDLQSERRHRGLVANAANGGAGGGGAGGGSGSGGPSYPVWPQYLALVVGIFVQPYLSYYVQHGSWCSISGEPIVARSVVLERSRSRRSQEETPSFSKPCLFSCAILPVSRLAIGSQGGAGALGISPRIRAFESDARTSAFAGLGSLCRRSIFSSPVVLAASA